MDRTALHGVPGVVVNAARGPMMKWFGAKWNASRHYPEPLHDVIIEPFAGSACYALRHAHTIDRAIIWDTSPELAELWQWLIGPAAPVDVLTIPIVPPGVDILSLGLSHGQALLLKHWQRTNPLTRTWGTSPWGDKPGQWTSATRSRVASQLPLIKSWEFRRPSANDIGCWFIDPPYQHNYAYKQPPVNYAQLASACQIMAERGQQVIVCEARAKDGTTPYWLPFAEFRSTVTSRRKSHQSHHSHELVWTSDMRAASVA